MYWIQICVFVAIAGVAEISGRQVRNADDCLDVAIVGGGISGTYTGWRLRDKSLKINIFENTNRIGGRICTVFFPSAPDVPLDLGAMRYIPGEHTQFESLLETLDLKTKVFKLCQHAKMYYLRGKRMSIKQLDSSKLPYNLAEGESRDLDQLKWYVSQRALNVSEPDQISDIEEAVTADGIPVYKQGHLTVLDAVASNEAIQYIRHTGVFYTEYTPSTNAVHYIVAPNPNAESIKKRTVAGGLNQIPEKLAEEFKAASDSHEVKLNRRVDSVKKTDAGYDLKIYETETVDGYTQDKGASETVCAKKVILAVPPKALKGIKWDPLKKDPKGKEMVDSVRECTAMKIFLAYPNAWWDSSSVNQKGFITDLPLRYGGEFGRSTDESGNEVAVMLSYADGTVVSNFFKNLRDLGGENISSSGIPASLVVNKKIVEHVHRHLATLYNVSPDSIPAPLDGVIQFWKDDRNGQAWQYFKPGYQPKVVYDFMLRPSSEDQVFVVTNGFTRGLSDWAEGCIRAADDVLGKFFNVA